MAEVGWLSCSAGERREGGLQPAVAVRGRVPIRGTGADRLVVAVRVL